MRTHTPTLAFEVRNIGRTSTAGEALFTVVEYRDGEWLGGDHHWVRERYAVRCKALYDIRPELHGQPSSVLAEEFDMEFGRTLFDKDGEA